MTGAEGAGEILISPHICIGENALLSKAYPRGGVVPAMGRYFRAPKGAPSVCKNKSGWGIFLKDSASPSEQPRVGKRNAEAWKVAITGAKSNLGGVGEFPIVGLSGPREGCNSPSVSSETGHFPIVNPGHGRNVVGVVGHPQRECTCASSDYRTMKRRNPLAQQVSLAS